MAAKIINKQITVHKLAMSIKISGVLCTVLHEGLKMNNNAAGLIPCQKDTYFNM